MIRALPILLVLGCYGDPLPEVSGPYKVHAQDKALLYTQFRVEDSYAVDLGETWEKAKVHWSEEKCPYNRDDYAVVYRERCYYGIMFGCDAIYVALSNLDAERTCGSALLHEFGHCLLGAMGFPMDADHENDRFWTVIEDAHEETCERGW